MWAAKIRRYHESKPFEYVYTASRPLLILHLIQRQTYIPGEKRLELLYPLLAEIARRETAVLRMLVWVYYGDEALLLLRAGERGVP